METVETKHENYLSAGAGATTITPPGVSSTTSDSERLGVVQRAPLVAVADDDDDIRSGLATLLAHEGYVVTSISHGEKLVEYLENCRGKQRAPDILILDHRMPGYCGIDVLEGLRIIGWTKPIIMITAFGPEVLETARGLGARAIFEKPFEPHDLLTAVAYWLREERPRPRTTPAFDDLPTGDAPRCVLCHVVEEVRLEPQLYGLYFCSECWERCRPHHEHEEIEVGD